MKVMADLGLITQPDPDKAIAIGQNVALLHHPATGGQDEEESPAPPHGAVGVSGTLNLKTVPGTAFLSTGFS